MQKNTIVTVIVLLIILGAILVFSQKNQTPPTPASNPLADLTKVASQARTLHADVKGLLTTFPADFPLEAGAETTTGYKYVPANSLTQQSTLEYGSKLTLAENGKIFADYFSKAGFKITNKVEQPGLLIYYGTKNQSVLTVKVQKLAGKVTVSASYVAK